MKAFAKRLSKSKQQEEEPVAPVPEMEPVKQPVSSPLKEVPQVVEEVIKAVAEPVNDVSMSPSKKRPLAEISTQAAIAPQQRNLL